MDLKRLILTAILLITITISFAQAMLWQDNGIPIKKSSRVRWFGSSDLLTDGSVIAIWEGTTENGMGILAQRYNSMGEAIWDSPVQVFPSLGYYATPYVGATSDGGFIVVCSASDNYYPDLQCMKYDADGNAIWDDFITVCESYAVVLYNVAIQADPDGGAYIVWLDDRDDWDIRVNHVDAGGNQWGDDGIVVMPGTNAFCDSNVCSDGEGGILVIGENWLLDTNTRELQCARVLPDGSVAWLTWLDEWHQYISPTVVHPDSESVVVLFGRSFAANNQMCYTRLDMDGALILDSPVEIGDYLGDVADHQKAYDAEGNVYVMWCQGIWREARICVHKISPDDQFLWGDEGLEVETGMMSIYDMMLDVTPDDDILVLWNQLLTRDTFTKTQLYNTDGESLWSEGGEVILENSPLYLYVTRHCTPDAIIYMGTGYSEQQQSVYQQVQTYDGATLYDTAGTVLIQGHEGYSRHLQAGSVDNRLKVLWYDYAGVFYDEGLGSFFQMLDENGVASFDESMQLFSDVGPNVFVIGSCCLEDGTTALCWKDTVYPSELHFCAIDDNGSIV